MLELESAIQSWLSHGATDVFLSEGEIPRVRMNGELATLEMEPLQRGDLETLWQACGASVENDRDRDVRLPMGSGGYLRVNLYRTMDKLAAAVRPIKEEIPELESLGLPTEMIRQWMTRSSGIIIVTGATGSGKSTTIASALEDLNRSRRSHVVTLEATTAKAFHRSGPAHKDFVDTDVLPIITKKSCEFIASKAKGDVPFFLYVPLNSPYTPISPSKNFLGKSGLGKYADFVMETDWSIGQVVKAVDEAGLGENTLIIVTADNGCSPAAGSRAGRNTLGLTFLGGEPQEIDSEKH